jgi:DNA polymerase-3 subunit gamma/tau
MEMDAASNRGIDDIRTLRERVTLAPAEAPFAVYVIDEVHMLTTEAFNALLKTLEEPPAHAIFILCTTELNKVPPTIVSRCQEIAFHKATLSEVVQSLKKAVIGEGIKISEEALTALASRVDGSFRDGMKFLEQLAINSQPITLGQVDDLMGFGNLYDPEPIIKSLKAYDMPGFLKLLDQRMSEGVDVTVLTKRLIEALRGELRELVTKSEIKGEKLSQVIALSQKLLRAGEQIKQTPISSLPLELAAAEWCLGKADEVVPIETIEKVVPVKQAPMDFKDLEQKWPELLRKVKPYNHSVEALWRAARPLKTEAGKLYIEVFYTFHKEQLEQERHIRVIEKVMSELWDPPMQLKFVLGEKAKKAGATAGAKVVNVTGQVADEKIAKAAEEIFG